MGAQKLLFSPEKFEILQALHDASHNDVKWIETPNWADLMSKEIVDEFPFDYTFEQVQNKPWVGLHTSGTTGHPKYVNANRIVARGPAAITWWLNQSRWCADKLPITFRPIYWTHAAVPLHASHVDRPYSYDDPAKVSVFQQMFEGNRTFGAFPLYHVRL